MAGKPPFVEMLEENATRSACAALALELYRRGLEPSVRISDKFEKMLMKKAPDLLPLYEQCINEVLLAQEVDW